MNTKHEISSLFNLKMKFHNKFDKIIKKIIEFLKKYWVMIFSNYLKLNIMELLNEPEW